VGDHEPAEAKVGDDERIYLDGRVVGAVLRTKRNVKPVYVSQVHRMESSLKGLKQF